MGTRRALRHAWVTLHRGELWSLSDRDWWGLRLGAATATAGHLADSAEDAPEPAEPAAPTAIAATTALATTGIPATAVTTTTEGEVVGAVAHVAAEAAAEILAAARRDVLELPTLLEITDRAADGRCRDHRRRRDVVDRGYWIACER